MGLVVSTSAMHGIINVVESFFYWVFLRTDAMQSILGRWLHVT